MKDLYATDFKESSKLAAKVLTQLHRAYTIDLISVHIVTSFWQDWLNSGLYEKEALNRLQEKHADIIGKKEPDQVKILKGSAAFSILEAEELYNPDLIVVGGGDPGAKREWITGTTAEAIVRESQCSVMLIKKPDIKRLLVAIDFDEKCKVALDGAAKLARKTGAELIVLHAIPAPDVNPFGLPAERVEKDEEKFRLDQIAKVNDFLKDIDLSGVKVTKENLWGLPHQVVLDYATDHNIDMIVIGTSRKSKVRQVLLGSTSARILKFAPASLYLVR